VSAAASERYPLTAAQQWMLRAYATTEMAPQTRLYRLPKGIAPARVRHALTALVAATPGLQFELVGVGAEVQQKRSDKPVGVATPEVPAGHTWTEEDAASWLEQQERVGEGGTLSTIGGAVFASQPHAPALLGLLLSRFAVDGRGFDLLEQQLDDLLAANPEQHEETRTDPGSVQRPADFIDEQTLVQAVKARLIHCTDEHWEPDRTVRPSRWAIELDADASAELWSGCRAAGISPAMAVATAQAMLLTTATGQDRTVLNLPIGNRSSKQAKATVGNYSFVVHVAVDLSGQDTIGAVRAAVRNSVLDAIRDRRVDPGQLYAAIYAELPFWPPGWDSICNVRTEPRSSELAVLTPVDCVTTLLDEDVACGTVTINARATLISTTIECVWDAGVWPSLDPSLIQELLATVVSADASTPVSTVAGIARRALRP